MWSRRSSCRSAAFLSTCIAVFAAAGRAQQDAQAPAESLESEVREIRAENGALREQLRKLEEQQQSLLRLVGELQRRIDQTADPAAHPAAAPQAGTAPAPPANSGPVAQSSPAPASQPSPMAQPAPGAQPNDDVPYNDSIVLVKTPPDAKIPILLRLWDVTQFRYTNTLLGNSFYTDHLGGVRPVITRNDFSLNRNLLQFVGYIFDPKLQYNLILWASNSSAAIVIGGYVSWKFNKAITLYGGYWGAPGTRTLTGTFPYFVQVDRSMADQFFRPGFTQGTWIDGQPWTGLNYELFVGNGLNTLGVNTNKIDTHLVYSGSVWWEPLGIYGIPGRARGMYDDYQAHKKPVIRIGTSYTQARENRFADQGTDNPENVGLYNSDGVNTFATGAFAPGVTVIDATYRMVSADAGVKWRGFAFNGSYFARWLNHFTADGPLPIGSTFDQGFETELSMFVVPKKWEVYARTSMVLGQFRTSYEYAPGFKFYPVSNHRVWVVAEGLRIVKSPLTSVITPYNSGFTGWAPLLQVMFNF